MSRDVRSHGRAVVARAVRLAALVPVLSLLLGSCDAILPPDDELATEANIRVINGAADEIRVRVDGDVLDGATPVRSFSARISLAEGADEVRVEPSSASSLTGGTTIDLPANGLGSGLGPTSILATSSLAGVLQATLVDDTDAIGQPGVSRIRVIHAAPSNREIDIWYSNPNSPTLTRMQTPLEYGDVTAFIETLGQAQWRIAVTPRMVPTPGEDPEPQVIASVLIFVGNQNATTMVVMDETGGGVKILERPMP